jgi:LysM repeat protein
LFEPLLGDPFTMTAAIATLPSHPRHLRHPPPAQVLQFPTPRTAVNRPTEATYRRRRSVVGITLAVFVALGVVAAHDVLAGSGGVPASAAASQPALAQETVVAQPGDSLWSIASEHHGAANLRDYLDTLVDINGGPTIQLGQTIVLP